MLIADEFSFGSLVFGPVLAIFALAGLFFVCVGLARIVTGGRWDIRVDEETISWQAPLMAETSFSYPPGSVARIDRRIRRKTREDGRIKEKRALFLVTQDGSEHRLNKQSGVDLDAFATACADLGVARREMVIPYASRRYEAMPVTKTK